MNINIVNKINKENQFVYLIYKDQNGKKVRQEITDYLNINLDNEIKKYKIEVSTYQYGSKIWIKKVFFFIMLLPFSIFGDSLPSLDSDYIQFMFNNRDANIDVFFDDDYINTHENLTGDAICLNPFDNEGNYLDFKVSYFKDKIYMLLWIFIPLLCVFLIAAFFSFCI